MTSDPFPHESHADLKSGTASVPTVTDAMMDHAAHLVTEQVDILAQHAPGDRAMEAATVAGEVAEEATASAGEVVRHGAAASEVPAVETTQGLDRVAAAASEMAGQTLDASEPVAAEVREAAASAGRAAQASLSGAPEAFSRYNAKLFEMIEVNLATSGAHMTALLQARSVPDALALNADYLRRQLDTMTAQGRELTTLAQKISFDVLQPLKTVIATGR